MAKTISIIILIGLLMTCVSTDSSTDVYASSSVQSSLRSNSSDASACSSAHAQTKNKVGNNNINEGIKRLICTGENEVSGCNSTCPPQTCESIGRFYKCRPQPTICRPACRCKPNYYRNKVGDCISKQQCLTCTGPNEYFGFGTPCDNECANLSKPNQTCPYVNVKQTEMCYCEEGYARADNKTCIPIEKCPRNCDQDNENKNEDSDNSVEKFSQGNVAFTELFFYIASQLDPGVSAIYSPFSLSFLLAQLALYTSGTSLDELLSVLNISKSEIRSTIPYYLTELNSQENVTFSLAERVYANIEYTLNPCFVKDTGDIFDAKAQNTDFSKPTEAANTINEWVANKTNNMIKDLVPADSLSRNTILVLVNAIYFKGDWKYPFKIQKTKKEDFYVNQDKNITVNMMNQVGSFKYADIPSQGVQVVELPYVNSNFSYLVLLPKLKDGLNELLEQIRNKSNSVLQDSISMLQLERVDLSLPSLETTTTTDLKDVLEKLNVSAIFDPDTANLNGISDDPTVKPSVTSAVQKARIKVTETGSEAAAGNAIVISRLSVAFPPPQSVKFIANHPFVHFIMYKGTPIFCGVFAG